MEARKVRRDDIPVVAAAAARAFYDDPITSFIFPKDTTRLGALQRFFSLEIARMYLPYGEVYTTNTLEGVSIWGTPERKQSTLRDALALFPIGRYIASHPLRALRVLSMLEEKHPKEPHFYLATLGVDPSMQGKGLGTLLMAPVLARCDAEGVPAYLESSKEKNVPLYARHGFQVTEVIELPGGGPQAWLMWREPR